SQVHAGRASPSAFADSAYATYSAANGLAVAHQKSSGTSVGVRLDTRDNGINAERGWLGSATYRTFFKGFLGGDSTWQELALDVRTYQKLDGRGRQKLAFWFLGDMVSGPAPFLDLPTTGSE